MAESQSRSQSRTDFASTLQPRLTMLTQPGEQRNLKPMHHFINHSSLLQCNVNLLRKHCSITNLIISPYLNLNFRQGTLQI